MPTLGSEIAPPKPQTGRRRTKRLTDRGARIIKGAAFKADLIGLPLKTFMTFTMRPDARKRLDDGELVLGDEVRRTLNALGEWFRRRNLPRMAYIWVAENPGGCNPHVHLLTNHSVPRSEFDVFAAHVESLWGHGYVKIERIRQPKSAGQYLLKAVGYVAKGSESDQGEIVGNRYGLSKQIRPVQKVHRIDKCGDITEGLLSMVVQVGPDEIVELDGAYLTRWGIAFPAGTSDQHVVATMQRIRDWVAAAGRVTAPPLHAATSQVECGALPDDGAGECR